MPHVFVFLLKGSHQRGLWAIILTLTEQCNEQRQEYLISKFTKAYINDEYNQTESVCMMLTNPAHRGQSSVN